MRQWILRFFVMMFLGLGTAVAWNLWNAPDASHRIQEWLRPEFRAYNPLIEEESTRQGIDPLLVKAVVWRESRFAPHKTGAAGERGLMQVMEPAAADWVQAEKIGTFRPTDLFDPGTNLKAGVWYLARALGRWQDRENPEVFALAEYNAGRSRLLQWVAKADEELGRPATGLEVLEHIDFPTTKAYILSVRERHRLYALEESSSPTEK